MIDNSSTLKTSDGICAAVALGSRTNIFKLLRDGKIQKKVGRFTKLLEDNLMNALNHGNRGEGEK